MKQPNGGSGDHLGRRGFLAAVAVSPLLLSGCFGGAASQGSADTGNFPVTIPHLFGETTVTKVPTRIATLGFASQDACVELGVVPVGVPAYEARGFGTSLWFGKAITSMNAVMPAQYREVDGPPYDSLKSLKPDLILAVNSGITRNEYDTLSKIAPVIAYPGTPFGTDWRTTTLTVGKAIGRSQAAKELVANIEKEIAKAKSSYSDLAGSSFLYLGASSVPGADFEVYDENSNPVRILEDFGVVPSPSLDKVKAQGKRQIVRYGVSPLLWESRRGGELQADIDVVAVNMSERADIAKNGVLDVLPAAKRNSLAVVQNSDDALALLEASPLGVKWVLWTVMPELARAAYQAKHGSGAAGS
ncbi:ABC transporter substrate-binding protein [Arthrobacter sp. 2MCAF14]|uniref:ABC transporter substrate-binding protein n=1 Tax=Arthrobacter sp. 2MCAF14 TaxID=3232982 RepID=UPI003F8F1366